MCDPLTKYWVHSVSPLYLHYNDFVTLRLPEYNLLLPMAAVGQVTYPPPTWLYTSLGRGIGKSRGLLWVHDWSFFAYLSVHFSRPWHWQITWLVVGSWLVIRSPSTWAYTSPGRGSAESRDWWQAVIGRSPPTWVYTSPGRGSGESRDWWRAVIGRAPAPYWVSPGRRADLPRPPATIGSKGKKPEIYFNLHVFLIIFMPNSYIYKNSYFGMPGDGR